MRGGYIVSASVRLAAGNVCPSLKAAGLATSEVSVQKEKSPDGDSLPRPRLGYCIIHAGRRGGPKPVLAGFRRQASNRRVRVEGAQVACE